jgi:hypothetical protein
MIFRSSEEYEQKKAEVLLNEKIKGNDAFV